MTHVVSNALGGRFVELRTTPDARVFIPLPGDDAPAEQRIHFGAIMAVEYRFPWDSMVQDMARDYIRKWYPEEIRADGIQES